MKKQGLGIIVTLFLSCFICTACGSKTDTYVGTAMKQIQELDYQSAMDNFDQAENAGEDMRLVLRGRGIVYLARAQYEDAINCFVEALGLSGGIPESMDYDINYYLATAYYKSGKFAEAISVYDAIIGLKPKEKDAYFLRGTAELAVGDVEAAKKDFDQAISFAPDDYDQIINIYEALENSGNQESATELLQGLLDNSDKMSDYERGRLAYYTRDYAQAKEALEKANAKKSDAETVLYLGRTYEAMGDYNYAIDTYRTYLDNNSDQPLLFNQMGICQMKMEKYADALQSFQDAMKIEGTEIVQTLKFNEIVAYEYMGEFQTAATLMNDYLKSYPDDVQAKREYEFLRTR